MRKHAIILIALLVFTTLNATAIIHVPEVKAQGPTLELSQVYDFNQTGTTFIVNVTIKDVTQMWGWNMIVEWNPNITKVSTGDPAGVRKQTGPRRYTYYNIYEGDFMKNKSLTSFVVNTIDNTNGIITNMGSQFTTAGMGVTGSGLLARINFTLLNVGTTVLNVTLSSVQGLAGPLDHATVNGLITDQPPPVPPPFWLQSWFLTTVAVVIVVTVLPTVLIIRLRSHVALTEKQIEKIKEYEEKVEGEPYIEDSEKTSKKA